MDSGNAVREAINQGFSEFPSTSISSNNARPGVERRFCCFGELLDAMRSLISQSHEDFNGSNCWPPVVATRQSGFWEFETLVFEDSSSRSIEWKSWSDLVVSRRSSYERSPDVL